ncbi:ATP-binding cassette domain-containing protein [Coprococcus comes]|uniref:ATP-binding cassette domain-containing protein n=1 Tax=Coprococcus comes TaxID=410072 RepID=UPI002FE6D03B
MNKYVIETKQLTKTYGEQTVVNSVNIHVKQGQIYGLLGRNGAGKTTIMKMILGLTDITSGEVDVFGQNIKGREKRVYPRIGAIIETPGFYPNLTGTENLEIFAKLRGTAAPNAVKNALEIVGLPYRDKKLFSKYSLGMKQRLGIANAILHDPELLILDEPTNGLDPIGIAEVRDFIKTLSIERGKTILISSHILSEIALLSYSVCFMLLTAIASVFFGMLPGYITFEWNSISYLFKKCIEIAILTAFSILPLLAVAAAGKNYILPVCVTLVYTFLSFILLMVNMYLHPLSSATAIIMRDIPGVILAQEVNIPAALFCIGIWTIVSIVFAYISLKHRK